MATVFAGGTYVNTTFTGTARQDLLSNLKAQLVTAGWTNVAQATSQGPGNVGTFTVTIASPGVCSFSGHGWLGGERVVLQTTGALPTGLSVNTVYFIKYIDANNFKLATTSGGTDINTSGSQSGTHTINTESILLQSATQATVTNPIRVRLKDNRLTCIQVTIENQAGTVKSADTNAGAFLLPGALKTFQVIATKYWFIAIVPTQSSGRDFVWAGMLYVPSLLTSITDHGFLFSASWNDGSGGGTTPIRSGTTSSPAANSQFLWNASFVENANNSGNGQGTVQPLYPGAVSGRGLRWSNDALLDSDVLVTAGVSSGANEGKIKGLFYDATFIAAPFTLDATDSQAGHNWQNLSDNFTTGGIWVATS